LLLRLAVGVSVVLEGVAGSWGIPHRDPAVLQWLAAEAGTLLLLGLWTPLTGALLAVAELALALERPEQAQPHLFMGILAVCLAMLGPGAWSIDARLFGRKRIEIPDR